LNYALKYKKDIDNGGFEKNLVNFRRRHLIDIFIKLGSKNIVEIGCGTEPLFCWYSNYDKIQIIERSVDFCLAAQQELDRLKNINSKQFNSHISIDNIPFEDCKKLEQPVDMVILSGVLHEVDDAGLFLHHLRSLLEENEYVYINVPNANSLHRLLAFHSGMIDDLSEISERGNFFGHKRGFFTLDELTSLVKQSGFEVIDSGSVALKPFTNAQMDKLFDNDNIANEALLDALFYPDNFLEGMGSELWMLVNLNKKE